MRCLIYAKSIDSTWVKDYFPEVDRYLLKLVNKPLLEYYIDFASILKITSIRIVSDTSIKEIENHFKDGARWGLDISYSLARPEDSLKSVYLKNMSFCREEDLVILDGFFFIVYDHNNLISYFEESKIITCNDTNKHLIYLSKDTPFKEIPQLNCYHDKSISVQEISSILDYYSLSMEILKNKNKSYVLPGYSNEQDAFYGVNFIFPHTSRVNKPLMIGNNVRFRNNTSVGPAAIIGNNVIIDENTTITESIVYEDTYVSSDLELSGKIIYKNHLISGLTGDSILLTDNILVSQIEMGIMTSFFNRFVQWMISLVLITVLLLPWLFLYLPYRIWGGKQGSDFIVNKNLGVQSFIDPEKMKKSKWGQFLLHLQLDKFGLLLLVLNARLLLVGNQIFRNNTRNRKLVNDLPVYTPGVYSLFESIDVEHGNVEIFYELEYINNFSTIYNLKILMRVIWKRFCYGYKK